MLGEVNATDCCYEWMSFFFDSAAAVVGTEPVERRSIECKHFQNYIVHFIFIYLLFLLQETKTFDTSKFMAQFTI